MDHVSVVIPAFNAACYIKECVDSALAQTYPACEVIVVDDGSTDDTTKILAGYGDRIHVIRQANQGSSGACNTGVEAAGGKWIAFLDADDVWMPEKTARQLEACGEFGISFTDARYFGADIERDIRRSEVALPEQGQVLRRLLIDNFITKSSVMVHRDIYQAAGGFGTNYPSVEDWPLWLRICAQHELGYLHDPLVLYRVHQNSKSMSARRTMEDHRRIIDEVFSAGGVGEQFPQLRRLALASSFRINSHYASVTDDWTFAARCALASLRYQPTHIEAWRCLARAVLIPFGRHV